MIIFLVGILVFSGVGFTIYNQITQPKEQEKEIKVLSMEYPHYESIDDLSITASSVVKGKIVDIRVEEIDIFSQEREENEFVNPGGDMEKEVLAYTVFTLEIKEVYKGNYGIDEYIEVKQLGGETDEYIYISEAELDLNQTYEYVFFLESYSDVPDSILNPYQSVYIFNSRSRSLSDILISVSDENDLILTYEDLKDMGN